MPSPLTRNSRLLEVHGQGTPTEAIPTGLLTAESVDRAVEGSTKHRRRDDASSKLVEPERERVLIEESKVVDDLRDYLKEIGAGGAELDSYSLSELLPLTRELP